MTFNYKGIAKRVSRRTIPLQPFLSDQSPKSRSTRAATDGRVAVGRKWGNDEKEKRASRPLLYPSSPNILGLSDRPASIRCIFPRHFPLP